MSRFLLFFLAVLAIFALPATASAFIPSSEVKITTGSYSASATLHVKTDDVDTNERMTVKAIPGSAPSFEFSQQVKDPNTGETRQQSYSLELSRWFIYDNNDGDDLGQFNPPIDTVRTGSTIDFAELELTPSCQTFEFSPDPGGGYACSVVSTELQPDIIDEFGNEFPGPPVFTFHVIAFRWDGATTQWAAQMQIGKLDVGPGRLEAVFDFKRKGFDASTHLAERILSFETDYFLIIDSGRPMVSIDGISASNAFEADADVFSDAREGRKMRLGFDFIGIAEGLIGNLVWN